MKKFFVSLILVLLVSLLLVSCGGETDEAKSKVGETCSRTADCESGLSCIDSKCTKDDIVADGDDDPIVDGDGTSEGLMWQSSPASDEMYWSAGIAYCNNLSEGGFDDWRLPSIDELRTLFVGCPKTETGGSCNVTNDCLSSYCWTEELCSCEKDKGPTDGCYFASDMLNECEDYSDYWSSSQVDDSDMDSAWYVNPHGAQVGYYPEDENIIQCVRGE